MSNSLLGIFVLFIVIVLSLLVMSWKKKKGIYKFVTAGCFIFSIVCIITLYHIVFYYHDETVSVAMSADEIHENFKLNIKSKILNYEKFYLEFASKLDMAEIKEQIQKQYKDAVVVEEDNRIRVTVKNAVIAITLEEEKNFLFPKRNIYVMKSECISLRKGEEDYINIPFPKEYLNVEGAYENVMNISCTWEQLAEFYHDFSNVRIHDDEIVITQDSVIRVKLLDGKVYITVV